MHAEQEQQLGSNAVDGHARAQAVRFWLLNVCGHQLGDEAGRVRWQQLTYSACSCAACKKGEGIAHAHAKRRVTGHRPCVCNQARDRAWLMCMQDWAGTGHRPCACNKTWKRAWLMRMQDWAGTRHNPCASKKARDRA
eukprot:363885-Chlamydomonas_euryale.AAC.18